MPTPEEIKKLSEAYAEYMCPVGDYCGGVYDDQRNTDLPIYKDDAKSVIEWLCKTHCIVPKSKVKNCYGMARNVKLANTVSQHIVEDDYQQGVMDVLQSIFGSALFNEEKE